MFSNMDMGGSRSDVFRFRPISPKIFTIANEDGRYDDGPYWNVRRA